MKYLSKIAVAALLLGVSLSLCGEDNNPCLHTWGAVQYDCDTQVIGGSITVDCNTTPSEAVSRIRAASSKRGRCKRYRLCTKCGERDNLSDHSFSDLSCGPLQNVTLDPGGHIQSSAYCEVYATCHERRSAWGSVTVSGHDYYVMTDTAHRGEHPCHMTGHLPYDRAAVSLQTLKIPIGSTCYFWISWENPAAGGVTNGYTEFGTQSCRKCGDGCTWAMSPQWFAHDVTRPAPESTGIYVGHWYGYIYGYWFPEISLYNVKFTKECTAREETLWPGNVTTQVGGCTKGEYEFTINTVGVQSLDYAPKNKKVHYKEIGEVPSQQKTLYVLSEITQAQASQGGNKAREATPITFAATPTGSAGWPSVHPVLGGISDSDLSEQERAAKHGYQYPQWTSAHLYYSSHSDCIPNHYDFTGTAGSPTATFTGKQVGDYRVTAQCGTENNPADPNDNLGVRKRYIKVCNPRGIAVFDKEPIQSGSKVLSLPPCDPPLIPITFGGIRNGIPNGEKAYLEIDADIKTYKLYRDPGGCIEAVATDRELEITDPNYWNTLYLRPIQVDSDTQKSKYKIVTRYGIHDTLIKSDEVNNELCVLWDKQCSSGGICTAPSVCAKNNDHAVQVQGSFGQGAWGKSGGAFQISADSLNCHLLSNQSFKTGENEDGEDIIHDPILDFSYSGGSGVQIATETDAAGNSSYAAGYPIRVKTGQYCSEFTYRQATVGGVTFVDKITMTQYLSNDTDATVPMSGATPIAVTTLELVHDATLPAGAEEPTVTALNVANTQYSGGAATIQNWSYTAPATTCPDLTGDYTISQMNQNGVNHILVKQEYTVGDLPHRREIHYVGSMTSPASKEDRTYCRYPWGEELVSETVHGETTVYEFYTTPSEPGYSKTRKVTYPQGNSTSYQYNANREIATQTEQRGNRTYVTTFEYSYDSDAKKHTTTATQRVGDTVVSKNRTVAYDVRPNAQPDESIRYDENDTAFVTRTWYVQGPNGTYDLRPSRQENPDGTETRYSYSRSGGVETTTTETGVFSNNVLTLGTRQVSIADSNGVNLSNEMWFIDSVNGLNIKTASTVNSNFDAYGRPQTTTYLDGSIVTRTYGCCGVATETDRDGVTTTYAYDDFKRVSHTVRDGVTTLYTYDALGNQVSVTVKGRNDGEITTTQTYSNGELAAATDALGHVTSYSRSYATSGTDTTYTETVTNPDGSTQITVSVNGEQSSIGGTAVHGQTMTYGANWQQVNTPVTSGISMTVKSYSDMLGRNFKTEYADGSFAMNYYNQKNQVVKTVTPGGVTTLYEYDALGRQVTQAIDMNGNGEIDTADLVTSTAYAYGTQDGKTVSITTQSRSQGANSAVILVRKQSVDGLDSWQTDLNGLTTHTKQERLGGGSTRQTVTNPDGTKVVTNMTNGRVTTTQQVNSDNTNGNLTTFTYDEFNRQIGATETNGNTMVNTTGMTYNAAGQVLTQTLNGQTTSFVYDSMGRQTQVTAPGGVVTNTTYYPTGEVQRIDGATYPVEYTYNGLGQQATMTTFKDANTPQVTTWSYNNRGFMVQKTYADNNSVSYTYNADGQLLTRTWARGIVTTYTYDAAGRQTGYSYSDGTTPAVALTLNYLDQPAGITDAAGTRAFTYNADHLLATETNPSILNGVTAYTYDNAGRRTGMNLGDGTNSFAQANYTYDAMGRITTVGNGTDTLTYTYVLGTNQIASSAWQNATVNTVNTYDQYKRLTNIAVNNANVYGYTLNAKNQRTGATLPDGNTWVYTYDTLGQLSGAQKQDNLNNPLASMSYLYDLIGNRTSATENNAVTSYVSNLVNQYTAVNSLVPTYDMDGNMTGYNGWSFTWNGENRLIAAENTSTGVRVEADYDYMGRRVFKKVYHNNTLTKHSVFAYDGFKQVAEFDALNGNAQTASYLWQPVGLDVPLLRVAGTIAEYCIADGNKNIIQLRDVSGAVTDSYVYDPFGSVTHTGGSDNPFQFSSEVYDNETGLVYYNYRYYSPSLGRWIKRDPIEEQGGMNLYVMLGNNINNLFDQYGWKGCCGRDVTKVLNNLLREVRKNMRDFLEMEFLPAFISPTSGWDIIQFASPESTIYQTASQPECNETAGYNGDCYKMTALNYMLWGELISIWSQGNTGFFAEPIGRKLVESYINIFKIQLNGGNEPISNELDKLTIGTMAIRGESFRNARCAYCSVSKDKKQSYSGKLDAVIMLGPSKYIRIDSNGHKQIYWGSSAADNAYKGAY